MARETHHDSLSKIYDATAKWRDQCLIGGSSLFWQNREVWSKTNLRKFKTCFIDRKDTSDKSFEQKFKAQLATENEEVTRLACELLFIYSLFTSGVKRPRKSGLIHEVAGWKGVELDENSQLFDCFDKGIGHPGPPYNFRRPSELTYLARFATAVTNVSAAERKALLRDHVRTQKVLDDLVKDHREEFGWPPQLRHILLHLLFPDDYERIASEGDKASICEAFSEIIDGDAPDDFDDYLRAIRRKLEEKYGNQIDFYRLPLNVLWLSKKGKPKKKVSIKKATQEEKNEEELTNALFNGDLEDSSPEVKEKTQKVIARNKKAAKYLKDLYKKCQITADEFTFKKTNGKPYTEAHHLIPLGKGGADAPHNLVVVSAHIHRMLHYAEISGLDLSQIKNEKLPIKINGKDYTITWHPDHAKVVEAAQKSSKSKD